MKRFKVKELVVPISEYAVIPEDASLFEAVIALEKAQLLFDRTRDRHRAILVEDANHFIIGKIGQLDVLRALEPKYFEIQSDGRGLAHFGFSKKFLLDLLEMYKLFDRPMDDICRKAGQGKVSRFMHRLTDGEYIDQDASLDEAIHLLVAGHHQSLLVTQGDGIVGILRLTDVFTAIVQAIKTC